MVSEEFESDMSDEFKDIDKKNKYKGYIIILLLYIVVIILTIFLILGIKSQKEIVEESINKTMQYINLDNGYN